ncbi:MAG: hypothetical protein A2Y64_07355 [Candidatus Coatesbacteria bacterium RBG_13_66_14]|uniref:Uncharacterized protein n=1 Tax=Candidatus Coatesbacteria bacterium RBG_13_66_14 TaxID=1817816 RepID=A0A1F5EWM3_9BACT|nr:MAG: hypothetical protein A2Y64_07355 [Candidatus Coatesbacteria bacterium RBG_13_66_14]
MRFTLCLSLIAALAVAASGSPFLSADAPFIPPRGGADAGYYFWDSMEAGEWAPVYEWFNPSDAQGWCGDDVCWSALAPFDIRFCGELHLAGSTVYVGSNGAVGFTEPGMAEPINQRIPDPAPPNGVIAPLWDNLHGSADGEIYLDLDGTAPERRWYITWSPWYFDHTWLDPIEFQIVFHETDTDGVNNTVEFRYRDLDGDSWRDHGASATVGLEDGSGLEAARYSFNQPVIPDEFAVRFVDQGYVDDHLGAFGLLTPDDGSVVGPGVPVRFSWEASEYGGHGQLLYALSLSRDPDFGDVRVFDTGADAWMDYIFGTGEIGPYWWKVMARETDLGLTRWSEGVFTLEVSASVIVESSWGTIKAEF